MKTLRNISIVLVFTLLQLLANNLFAQDSTMDMGLTATENNLYFNNNTDPYALENKKVDFELEIDWGRRSKNCRGFGICTISLIIEFRSFVGVNQDGSFTLLLNDNGLNEVTTYFGDNKIILEEDYVLPEDLTKKMGLKDGYSIKKGTYLISRNPNQKSAQKYLIKM